MSDFQGTKRRARRGGGGVGLMQADPRLGLTGPDGHA